MLPAGRKSRRAALDKAEKAVECAKSTDADVSASPEEYAAHHLAIRVPADYRESAALEVRMVTFDYWFPAGEIGSPDLRCLGVLVKADKEVISAPVRFNRWRSTESFPAPTSEEAGRLADLSFNSSPPLPEGNAARYGGFANNSGG